MEMVSLAHSFMKGWARFYGSAGVGQGLVDHYLSPGCARWLWRSPVA